MHLCFDIQLKLKLYSDKAIILSENNINQGNNFLSHKLSTRMTDLLTPKPTILGHLKK